MGIGTNIKKILAIRNMTIKELSEKSGIPKNTLYSLTRRDSETTRSDYLNRIAAALGVGVEELISIPTAQVITGLEILSQPNADIPAYLAKKPRPQDVLEVAELLTPESVEKLMQYALDLAELERFRKSENRNN